jgi:hypothetical protein
MMGVALVIENNLDLNIGLSEDGRKTLIKAIWMTFYPVTDIVLVGEYQTIAVSKRIVLNVQKELTLMSYSWCERLQDAITEILDKEVSK